MPKYRYPVSSPELRPFTTDTTSPNEAIIVIGRNHLRNVVEYYQCIGHEKAQSVIDSITSSYAAEGQANPMQHIHMGGPAAFGPPPFGFPGGMPPPPPFGMQGTLGASPASRSMPNMPSGFSMPPHGPPTAPPPFGTPGSLPFPLPFPPPAGLPFQPPGMPPNVQFPQPGGIHPISGASSDPPPGAFRPPSGTETTPRPGAPSF